MGLAEIKENLKYLSPKDAEKAKKLIENEDWDVLLGLLEDIVDDANVDVVLAAEEDNGQTVKEKSELLDKLINLKFKVEDYVDALDDDYDEAYNSFDEEF